MRADPGTGLSETLPYLISIVLIGLFMALMAFGFILFNRELDARVEAEWDRTLTLAAERARADERSCLAGTPPADRPMACETAPFAARTGDGQIARDMALCARSQSRSAFCEDAQRRADAASDRLRRAEERLAASPAKPE